MAAPRPTLVHYRGGSLTHAILITCVLHIRPKGHREPCNEDKSLSPAERLVGFEPGTFWFWSQHLNPLGHSPQRYAQILVTLLKGMATLPKGMLSFSKACSHFSILCIVKIGQKPEDVVLLKRSNKDIKCVDQMMINHDM